METDIIKTDHMVWVVIILFYFDLLAIMFSQQTIRRKLMNNHASETKLQILLLNFKRKKL